MMGGERNPEAAATNRRAMDTLDVESQLFEHEVTATARSDADPELQRAGLALSFHFKFAALFGVHAHPAGSVEADVSSAIKAKRWIAKLLSIGAIVGGSALLFSMEDVYPDEAYRAMLAGSLAPFLLAWSLMPNGHMLDWLYRQTDSGDWAQVCAMELTPDVFKSVAATKKIIQQYLRGPFTIGLVLGSAYFYNITYLPWYALVPTYVFMCLLYIEIGVYFSLVAARTEVAISEIDKICVELQNFGRGPDRWDHMKVIQDIERVYKGSVHACTGYATSLLVLVGFAPLLGAVCIYGVAMDHVDGVGWKIWGACAGLVFCIFFPLQLLGPVRITTKSAQLKNAVNELRGKLPLEEEASITRVQNYLDRMNNGVGPGYVVGDYLLTRSIVVRVTSTIGGVAATILVPSFAELGS